MIIRIAKLPFKIVKKLFGALGDGGRERPTPAPTSPPPAAPRPRYTEPEEEEDHGHDHGHSHSHSHEPEPQPEPVAEEVAEDDHGHSHDHAPQREGPPANISFEETPNPNAMKFSADRKVSDAALSFTEAGDHPLSRALFAIPGVKSVFAVNDFVTVTKDDAANWVNLTHPIVEALQQVV